MAKSYEKRARGRVMYHVKCDGCYEELTPFKEVFCLKCATGNHANVVEEYIKQQVEKRVKERKENEIKK